MGLELHWLDQIGVPVIGILLAVPLIGLLVLTRLQTRSAIGALAVAVTGVAGPSGGSDEKPVGLVFVHAVGPDGEKSVRTELPGDREMIRGRATAASLHLVRRLLETRHTAP